MESLKKINYIYTALGALIVGGAAYMTLYDRIPSIHAPFSISVLFPAILLASVIKLPSLSSAIFLIISIYAVIFIFWTRKLYVNEGKIPLRSLIFFPIMVLLSIWSLVGNWEYGLEYQGKMHTLAMYRLNLLFWIIMIFLFLINRKKRKLLLNFLFHLVFFVWFVWIAFPWLGELL